MREANIEGRLRDYVTGHRKLTPAAEIFIGAIAAALAIGVRYVLPFQHGQLPTASVVILLAVVTTFVGLRAESRIETAGMILNPWISIAWRHEWSTSRTQTAALVSMPVASFVAIGAKPASDALQVKVGASMQVTRTASLYATFEGEFTSKSPVYAGKGGVRFGW